MIELNNYIYKESQYRLNIKDKTSLDKFLEQNNLTLPKKACFFRYLYVSNNGKTFLFDMESFKFINTYGDEEKLNKVFKIDELIDNNMKSGIKFYNKEIAEKTISIKTFNKIYGNVTINLFKYSNPQLRNGLEIHCQNDITKHNSKGAILGNQNLENIELNDIFSDIEIKSFSYKASENIIKELFLDNKNVINIEKF